mmetsp:Transcript_141276/g.439062  ORF Transcript_141276/g.439062 Transcript_141276/m.439062 type:complete len:340 (-) Transcript_141276:4026-5045(-)
MRATPRESSLWGPSRTSTNSSGSSFLMVLLALMSNSLVIAISFTQRKYRSTMAKKLLRVMPSTPHFSKSICFCSWLRLRPFMPSSFLAKAASAILSLPLARSSKSASLVRLFPCMKPLSAIETWPAFASVNLSHVDFTCSVRALPFFSKTSRRCFCFAISCLASNHGPLAAFATRPSLDLRQALASETAAETPSAASVACLRMVSGEVRVSRSDSAASAKGEVACSSFCRAFWAASTRSVTEPSTSEAALRSFFSSCFLRSYSSLLECSCFPSSTFFWSCSSLERSVLTLGRILASSALASARGPCSQSLSSVLLDAMKVLVLFKVACVLPRVRSSRLM